jgi:repressor of nif and glnA expression
MQLELQIIDIVDEYKNKMNAKKIEDEENKKDMSSRNKFVFNLFLVQL